MNGYGPLTSNSTTNVVLAGSYGIPSNALAVDLNITALNETAAGYLVAYPTGAAVPDTSTLDYGTSTTVNNSDMVGIGSNGSVAVLSHSSGTTQMLVDVEGYFTSSAAGTAQNTFVPLEPQRIVDTRNGTGVQKQPLTSPGTTGIGLTATGMPSSGVAAVVLNVGTTNSTQTSFIDVWGSGQTKPTDSSVSFTADQTAQRTLIVPVSTVSQPVIDVSVGAGSTDVFADIEGYFEAPATGTGQDFVPLTDQRLVDTRNGTGGITGPVNGHSVTPVSMLGAAGIPSTNVSAVVYNLTVVAPSSQGYLEAYASDTTRPPSSSSISWSSTSDASDLQITPVGSEGTVDIYSTGNYQFLIDVVGYFATNYPAVPSAPSLDVLGTSGTLNLSWDSPSANGQAITAYNYSVSDSSGNVAASGSTAASARAVTVSGLTNGAAYTATLSATNSLGSGAPTTFTPVTPGQSVVLPASAVSILEGSSASSSNLTAPANGTTVEVGQYGGQDWTPYVHVDLSSLPAGAQVTGLTIGLGTASCNATCSTSAAGNFSAFDLLSPVTTSTAGSTAYSYQAASPSATSLVSSPSTLDITNDGSSWSTSAVNDGVALDVADTSNSGWTINTANVVSSVSYLLPSAPTAPQQLTAVAGDGAVNVQWQPPAQTNASNADVSYSVVTSLGASVVSTQQTTSTEVDVPGLADGSTYSFAVTDSTSYGSNSIATSATPAAVPGGPAAELQTVNDYLAAMDGLYSGTYSSVSAASAAFADGAAFSNELQTDGANALTYRTTELNDVNAQTTIVSKQSSFGGALVAVMPAAGTLEVQGNLSSSEQDQNASGTINTNPDSGQLWDFTFSLNNGSYAMTAANQDQDPSDDTSSGGMIPDSGSLADLDSSGVGYAPDAGTESGLHPNAQIPPSGGCGCDPLNRAAEVAWANRYVLHGPHQFHNDCTDYASETLFAGGLQGSTLLYQFTNYKYWWGWGNRAGYSQSWTLARGLYAHITGYVSAYVVTEPGQLQAGDLVFYVQPGQPINHVQVVVRAGSTTSSIMVDEHSANEQKTLQYSIFAERTKEHANPIYVHVVGSYTR